MSRLLEIQRSHSASWSPNLIPQICPVHIHMRSDRRDVKIYTDIEDEGRLNADVSNGIRGVWIGFF